MKTSICENPDYYAVNEVSIDTTSEEIVGESQNFLSGVSGKIKSIFLVTCMLGSAIAHAQNDEHSISGFAGASPDGQGFAVGVQGKVPIFPGDKAIKFTGGFLNTLSIVEIDKLFKTGSFSYEYNTRFDRDTILPATVTNTSGSAVVGLEYEVPVIGNMHAALGAGVGLEGTFTSSEYYKRTLADMVSVNAQARIGKNFGDVSISAMILMNYRNSGMTLYPGASLSFREASLSGLYVTAGRRKLELDQDQYLAMMGATIPVGPDNMTIYIEGGLGQGDGNNTVRDNDIYTGFGMNMRLGEGSEKTNVYINGGVEARSGASILGVTRVSPRVGLEFQQRILNSDELGIYNATVRADYIGSLKHGQRAIGVTAGITKRLNK